jgi:hypothetical protein
MGQIFDTDSYFEGQRDVRNFVLDHIDQFLLQLRYPEVVDVLECLRSRITNEYGNPRNMKDDLQ